jgi:hypothetical protein
MSARSKRKLAKVIPLRTPIRVDGVRVDGDGVAAMSARSKRKLAKVIPLRTPIRVDGVRVDDGVAAVALLLQKLADACQTLEESGYRDVRITISVKGERRR